MGSYRYSDSFRAHAVALVVEDRRSVRSVAVDLGVGESTLWKWVRKMRDERSADDAAGVEDEADVDYKESYFKAVAEISEGFIQ